MERENFQIAKDLNLCRACCLLVLDPHYLNDKILNLSGPELEKRFSKFSLNSFDVFSAEYLQSPNSYCPCCSGCLEPSTLLALESMAIDSLTQKQAMHKSLSVLVVLPPIIDALRVSNRILITLLKERQASFPTFETILKNGLESLLRKKYEIRIENSAESAEISMLVFADVQHQHQLSQLLSPTFKHKRTRKEKRGFGGDEVRLPTFVLYSDGTREASSGQIFSPEISRTDADHLIVGIKTLLPASSSPLSHSKTEGLAPLASIRSSLSSYFSTLYSSSTSSISSSSPSSSSTSYSFPLSPLKWGLGIDPAPIYLLGRYRKLSRDVPQSPWALGPKAALPPLSIISSPTSSSDMSSEGSSSPSTFSVRKGRNSVEEIIGEAALSVLDTSMMMIDEKETLKEGKVSEGEVESVREEGTSRGVGVGVGVARLHACGREDIDVRCLGNGRPFVLQLRGVWGQPTSSSLTQIVQRVNQGMLRNRRNDDDNDDNNNVDQDVGLNSEGDVELLMLYESNHSTWEQMQKEAEQKWKGYSCVVWCDRPINDKQLMKLERSVLKHQYSLSTTTSPTTIPPSVISSPINNEPKQKKNKSIDGNASSSSFSSSSTTTTTSPLEMDSDEDSICDDDDEEEEEQEQEDEKDEKDVHDKDQPYSPSSSIPSSSPSSDSIPCLQITQWTPLRVLHRRSLLPRRRRIFSLKTCRLNERAFLMNLVTSSGTYVKEFVHGDLGRTSPSVASMLGCRAEILQLDVCWLYDSFDGPTINQSILSTRTASSSSCPPVNHADIQLFNQKTQKLEPLTPSTFPDCFLPPVGLEDRRLSDRVVSLEESEDRLESATLSTNMEPPPTARTHWSWQDLGKRKVTFI